jgi:hypothetical protein
MLIFAVALKDAEDLLKDVMKAVDTNGDGKIQYEGTLSKTNGFFAASALRLSEC